MQKGIKFRIYPNKEQQNLINQTLGCCRFIYNKGLAMRSDAYKNGEKIGYNQTSAMLTKLKRDSEFSFLKEADSVALQQSLRDLDAAYKNFFQKRAKYPVFKNKHNHHQSYRTMNQGNSIRITGGYLRLPKLGYVKIRQSMEVGNIHNVTVEKTPTGKYFAVLNVDFELEFRPNKSNAVGIDMGIKSFYTDNQGNTVDNPKHLEKSMRKLIREQRKFSRKQKGSKNREKQRIKVALVHEKITNQRNDFLQKESTKLIRENQTICIENISVKELISDITANSSCNRQKRNLHRSQYAVSWTKFFEMLSYKAQWYGNDVIKTSKDFESSERCSVCGCVNPLVKDLSIRKWECPNCYVIHNRDKNAAVNIMLKGLAII